MIRYSYFVAIVMTASWYSIVQTSKLNHLDVFKYLETLLSTFTKRETPEIEAYLVSTP